MTREHSTPRDPRMRAWSTTQAPRSSPRTQDEDAITVTGATLLRMTSTRALTCRREVSLCQVWATVLCSRRLDPISWATTTLLKWGSRGTSSEKAKVVVVAPLSSSRLLSTQRLGKRCIWMPLSTVVKIALEKWLLTWSQCEETTWRLSGCEPRTIASSTGSSIWTAMVTSRQGWWTHMRSIWCGIRRGPFRRRSRPTKSTSCKGRSRGSRISRISSRRRWSRKKWLRRGEKWGTRN